MGTEQRDWRVSAARHTKPFVAFGAYWCREGCS